MDVEILIHGVPDGQDYYGIKEEQTNMGLFYDKSPESVKFVIETKKQGNSAYTYYSFLRYKGMIGAGGRPGSYFGLTLRLDKYYQDAIHIYNLMDIVFKRYIVGTLLIPSGDGYKYAVTNFAIKKAEIEQMQQAFIQLITGTCNSSKFLDLDASFIHPITQAPSANIADVSESAILASIKKYSKVVVSPDYETNIEKEYKKKLQEAEGKGGSIVAEKDKKIAEKDGVIHSLNTQISTQQSRITALEQEVKQKNTEIQQQKQRGDLSQLVAKIKEPITALADYFRVQDSPKPQPSQEYSRKNYLLGMLSCGLSVVVLVLCVLSLFRNPSSSNTDNKNVKKQEQLNEIRRLAGELRLKNDTIADLRTQMNQQSQIVNATPLRIDISGNGFAGQGSPMFTDKIYTIKVVKQGGVRVPGNTGNWKLTNATLRSGSQTDAQITIQPTGAGEVKLEYTPRDRNQYIYICRTETAQEPSVTASISISPSAKKVKDGESYTFTISGYTEEGEWRMDGFAIGDADKKQSNITVAADKKNSSNGKATISYYKSDGKKIATKVFEYEQNMD